jgi:cytochrome c551/c552
MNQMAQSTRLENDNRRSRDVDVTRRFGLRSWFLFVALPIFVFLVCLARADSRSGSGPVKIALPAETGSFKPGTGAALANGQCLTCHSVEYVVTQPAMPAAFWSAEVKKMREKYGAVIPDEQVEPLVNYFAENYGTATASKAATGAASTGNALVNPVISDDAMASKYGCLGCHTVNAKLVGPAFKDVVAKYQNDPAATDRILEQIRKGSSGKWGPALMPPFPMLPEAEAQALAHWVMRQGRNQPGNAK